MKYDDQTMVDYCLEQGWWNDEPEVHDLTCPVQLARELLEHE